MLGRILVIFDLYAGFAKGIAVSDVEGTAMPKVVGIGGVFFRATNPNGLAAWYEKLLEVFRNDLPNRDHRQGPETGQTRCQTPS